MPYVASLSSSSGSYFFHCMCGVSFGLTGMRKDAASRGVWLPYLSCCCLGPLGLLPGSYFVLTIRFALNSTVSFWVLRPRRLRHDVRIRNWQATHGTVDPSAIAKLTGNGYGSLCPLRGFDQGYPMAFSQTVRWPSVCQLDTPQPLRLGVVL